MTISKLVQYFRDFDDIAMHWEKAKTLFSGSLVLVWLHIDQIVGPR